MTQENQKNVQDNEIIRKLRNQNNYYIIKIKLKK